MKTTVNYNGMPITLNKAYATKELKRSREFVEKLEAILNGGDFDNNERGEQTIEILNRRKEWVKALEQYLGV